MGIARKKNFSEENFRVDGTLIQAWASQESFRPKGEDNNDDSASGWRNQEVDFHREKRLNDTHAAKTDPDARSFKKSQSSEAKLAYHGHTLMRDRNGLMVQVQASLASGRGGWDTAVYLMAELPGSRRKTVDADKNYDMQEFVDSS